MPLNLVVLRSLTKFYAIPGLRLGLGFAAPETAAKIRRLIPPWSVNALALAVGEKALADEEYAERTRAEVKRLRADYEVEGGDVEFIARRLFARYRLERAEGPVENELLRREIVHGQRVIEGRNLDIRRALWDYSTLVETQRRIVAGWRDAVFASTGEGSGGEADGQDAPPFSPEPDLAGAGSSRFGREGFERIVRRAALFQIDAAWTDHLAWLADLREGIHLVSLGRQEPLHEFQKAATESFLGLSDRIADALDATLRSLVASDGPVDLDAAGLKGPSATWTYLVNEDQFGWGVEVLKGTNIGFAAGAAAFSGPLFVFALLVNRLKKKEGVKP